MTGVPLPGDAAAAPTPSPPPGDGQVAQDFMAARALAQRPDPWKALHAAYGAAGATAVTPAAPATGAPTLDPNQPIGARIVQAAQTVAPPPPAGFLTRLGQAASGGAMQSLTDLGNSFKAVTGGKVTEAPPADYAKPLAWSDLAHPEDALTKAVYQVAHGMPVLAAGTVGAAAGAVAGAEGGAEAGAIGGAVVGGPPGAAAGATAGAIVGGGGAAIAGGALGAGAMSAAQELGPFYAAALKANPNDPAAAFQQAVKRAGAAGVFSAAGWALFGLKPFAGAVQNLMFQAFAVQPAAGAAGQVADNAVTGAPLTQGVAAGVPGSVIGTALPAMAHAMVRAPDGAPVAAEVTPAPAAGETPPGAPSETPPATAPADSAAGPAVDPNAVAVNQGGHVARDAPAAPIAEAAPGTPPQAAPAEASGAAGAAAPAADAPKDAAPAAPTPQAETVPLGDAKAAPVEIAPDIADKAQAYLRGESGDNPVKINLAYVTGPDAIKDTLARITTMLPGQDVQSHDSTTALALSLGLQTDDFVAGYRGSQLNAAETDAMRMLLESGADQVAQLGAAARDPAASPEAQAAFMHAFAKQTALVQYSINARAEAGRTLNAYQIMNRTISDKADALSNLILNGGGTEDIGKLAGMVADLNDPTKVVQFISQARKTSLRDMTLYGYYNIILSNIPHVLLKKMVSDVSAATWEMATRAIAPRLPGASGEVVRGEATQMLYGYGSAFGDALRLAGQGIATGERQFEGGTDMDAIRNNRVRTVAADAPATLGTDQPSRSVAEGLKMFLPTRWIGAADDFAKYMNYRAELRALAFRQASKAGAAPDELDSKVQEILAAPPDALHEQAVSNALRTTFQEPLAGLAQKVSDVADAINIPILGTDYAIPAGRMVLPFIKIPANLAAWSYRNSPIAAVLRSARVQEDMAAGGAARDIQVARMTMGTGLALASFGLAVNGVVTGRGPSDPGLNRAWRAAGNQPYSITIGGVSYDYSQTDPLGMTIGAIADTYDIMRFAPDHDRYNLAASLAFGLGQNMLSKTYMQGVSNLFEAFNSPDKGASKYVQQFVAGLTAPSALQGIEKMTDPWLRAHYGMLDGITARLPIVAQDLPVSRTLWGDPIAKKDGFLPGLSGTGVARAISPVSYGAPAANAQPIDKWIWDNRDAFQSAQHDTLPEGLAKPDQFQSFDVGKNVSVPLKLSPVQLDRFQEQAGNGLKMPGTGLGTKDYLNALVRGDNPDTTAQQRWNDANPAVQAMMVQKMVGDMRGAAKKQLLHDFPDLDKSVRAGAQARAAQLTGANGVRQGVSP